MKTKRWKQLLAGILCVTMVSVSTGPVVYAADESTTKSSFAKESYEQEVLQKTVKCRVNQTVQKSRRQI